MKPSPFAFFVIDTLLRRLRILSEQQIEMLASDFGLAEKANREIAWLERNGLVHSFQFEVKTLQLPKPLATWQPGTQPIPPFGKISWIAKSRFQKTDAVYSKLFFASEMAERQFGGVGGNLRQPNQITHDLGTSATFISHRRVSTPLDGDWIGEDMIRRFFRHLKARKIPDAAIISKHGIEKAIEFAGRDYSRAYLEVFHRFWAKKNIPYEIW